MPVLLSTAGKTLLAAPGVPLFRAPFGAGGGGPSGGTTIQGMSGLGAYWDASVAANMLASSGSTVAGWNAAVSSIKDSSGNGRPLSTYSQASGATLPNATPRLNGLLGGCGVSTVVPSSLSLTSALGEYLPLMGPDQGWQLPGVGFSASYDWSVYLVWSRPNQRQNGSTAPVSLVTIGSVPVATLTSTAPAPNTLAVFGTTVSAAIERRHTHSLILSYSAGTNTIAAYLDGATTGVTATAALGSGGPLTLLHDTTANGGAQCWFHEAAYWPRALGAGDIAILDTAASRWTRGARRGISLLPVGQSNAVNGYDWGAWHMLAQGIAWYLGALAYNVVGGPYQTLQGSQGLYPQTVSGDAGYPGLFLNTPSGTLPSLTWSLNTDGTTANSFVASQSSADLADIVAVFWPWSESDSGRLYSEKATFESGQQWFIAALRVWAGKTAANCPALMWNAIPFGGGLDPGMQMVREAVADLIGISGENAAIVLPNTCASGPNGTDYNHRGEASMQSYAYLAAPVAARAILAASGGDTLSAIPAGIPMSGGPRVTHVYAQSSTILVITVTHDSGYASSASLVVPPGAAGGVGWAVMDGGSLSTTPGTIISATACVLLNATQLQITLAHAPTNAIVSCLLYYPYGHGEIGTGNVVTDNYSTLTPPGGWNIAGDMGSALWAPNQPLAATTYGLAISPSPS